jgi:hypothetical protein
MGGKWQNRQCCEVHETGNRGIHSTAIVQTFDVTGWRKDEDAHKDDNAQTLDVCLCRRFGVGLQQRAERGWRRMGQCEQHRQPRCEQWRPSERLECRPCQLGKRQFIERGKHGPKRRGSVRGRLRLDRLELGVFPNIGCRYTG